ncbi:TonB-dependent receptor [Sphingomonas sp. JC676]|uniref:TonB-dependent receptor n=1 Tax=Sphingomonas sp. JC676 TaxID=2768065 RepID=UPI00165823BE|nr:TonB-dependent receptor [Sphingomonas sp. JC676]MBC9032733.1 TonB-dependent receptor [Sphingomonas sp. JC676]
MVSIPRRLTIAALLTSTAFAMPAFAQETETVVSDTDIVVTAQKREESLQNVPISIQALGTRKLDQLNISNFVEYSQLLPSLSFQTSQPGSTTVYMRGVASGGDGNHSGSLPSVGVYLDEQPITTIGGTLDVHIYDIARIESLAGPQGTLYGASSQAGTIRIITNKPETSSFYGRVDAEGNLVNKGGFGGKVEGMLNVPLSSWAALRMSGFYQHDSGYIDNVPGTRSFIGGISVNNNAFVKDDYNDVDTWGGRAALKVDLDDNWIVTPTVLYQESRTNGTFGGDAQVGDLKVQHFFPDWRKDRFIQAALTIEGRIGNWDVTYAGAYLDRKDSSSSDYTDYSEAYDSLYSSVGGLAGYFYYQDAAGNTIDPRQQVLGSDHFKKLSQELRVASPQDSPFRVVAGLFYQRQSNAIHQDYRIANLSPNLSVNGFPGTLWLTQQHRVDKDYAAFGEASFDILPTLTITGGGRVYKYDNSLIGFFGFGRDPAYYQGAAGNPPPNAAGSTRTGVAGCYTTQGMTLRDAQLAGAPTTLLPAAVSGSPCTNLADFENGKLVPKSTEGDGFLHRVNLTWKPIKDVLLYATWSRGYRPGGINRRATIAPYAADFLTNYEVGWKTTLADGMLRFNGSIYQQEWKKFQFSFLGQNSFTEIHNGPNARIRGVEADVNFVSGGLTLTAAGSYTDAKTRQNLCGYDDATYSCTNPGPDGAINYISAPIGTRLPVTPRFKINGTARYQVPIGSAKAYIQGIIAHQSSAASDVRTKVFILPLHDPTDPATAADPTSYYNAAQALGRLPAYTTGDLAIGAEFTSFTLEAFVQNIWDERGQISRFQECGSCGQRPYAVYIRPRTIGIRAGTKF